jgi:2-oxoglutarate ferredoxin oxidoreductase subunit gamma
MTGGQVGPTTPHNARAVTTQYGNFEYPFNLPYLAAAGGASYVARWTVLHARRLTWTLRDAMQHPGFSFVEIIAPCSTAYGRWNPEGRGLDPRKLRRRGLEMMKHFQRVGRVSGDVHPKDACIQVDGEGAITEIVEGVFLDTPRPELHSAIESLKADAVERWSAAHRTLEERVQLPAREDRVVRTEVQLGGFGGQGIMSAGRIIGQAATIYDHLEACFTQSYGPEARGGAAGSQVIIDSDPIHHPHLIRPGSAIIMSREAYAKYVPKLAKGAVILIDDSLVTPPEDNAVDATIYSIPATRLAAELGNTRTANSIMLGMWTAVMGVLRPKAMQLSLAESVPPKTRDVNLKAFDVGYRKGKQIGGRNESNQ